MAKVEVTPLTSLSNETSFLTALNSNFTAIQAALELMLSRDGTAPNTMTEVLDMNSERIVNLGAPQQSSDAVRKQDLDDLGLITTDEMLDIIDRLDDLDAQETLIVGYVSDAADSATAAAESAALSASYVGAVTSAPTWTTPRNFTITGDVTASPQSVDGSANVTFTTSLANDSVDTAELVDNSVTNAILADVATATIKGRSTAGTGNPEDLTGSQAAAILPAFTGDSGSGGIKGLVPAPSAGDAAANKFLKANGTWATTPDTIPDLDDLTTGNKTLTTSGKYQIGELILQWGTHSGASSSAGSSTMSFNTPFPNACLHVQGTARNSGVGPSDQDGMWQLTSFNASTATWYLQPGNGGVIPIVYWFAIGY